MNKTIALFAKISTVCLFCLCFIVSSSCHAQPYGTGKYSIITYGNETSLSINTDGDISIPITPTTEGVTATDTSNITVTSTDVTGYKLYIRTLNDANMNNLGALLPASNNVTLAPLAVDTWGYNIDGSDNFVGMNTSDALIKSVTAPVTSGDTTTVKYGLKLDLAKPAGNYTTTVVYTAVPQTD